MSKFMGAHPMISCPPVRGVKTSFASTWQFRSRSSSMVRRTQRQQRPATVSTNGPRAVRERLRAEIFLHAPASALRLDLSFWFCVKHLLITGDPSCLDEIVLEELDLESIDLLVSHCQPKGSRLTLEDCELGRAHLLADKRLHLPISQKNCESRRSEVTSKGAKD
eukprot:g12526.t1